MAYERVQKSFGQSSSKKKHNPIVPLMVDHPTQADSQVSPKTNPYKIPSKEERDAIKRQLFGNLTGANEIQSKTPESSSIAGSPIQAKLTIGAPGDKYEQEADKVAAQVINQINAPVAQQPSQNLQRKDMSEEDEQMMKSETSNIHREVMPEEEEELQMKPMVQLQSGAGSMTATPDLESSIQQARSGGEPLADNVITPMEQAFGADFSGVKVHTDTQADQLNQSIQARAFTTGQDVFFRHGEYNPGSRGGQELIAHELTHVVQQNSDKLHRSMHRDVLQRQDESDEEFGEFQSATPVIEVPIQGIESSHGDLMTKNLANCIAIVALNKDTEEAALYHFDTGTQGGFEMEEVENDEGETTNILIASKEGFEAAKKVLLQKLKTPNDVSYYISLGGLWKDDAHTKRMKDSMIKVIENVFKPLEHKDYTGKAEAYWNSTKKILT